jgi:hypothetical protein
MQNAERKVRSSEWLLVVSLIFIMAALVVIAKVNAHRASSLIVSEDLKQETVLVTIEGAVAKPGVYPVLAGSLVGEALRKARPKPLANLQILPLGQLVEGPLHIKVEELSEVTVYVVGAVVEPVEMVLPAGSRICDLKAKVNLTAEANKSFFRRRKLLKNGEKIVVPKKVVEVN